MWNKLPANEVHTPEVQEQLVAADGAKTFAVAVVTCTSRKAISFDTPMRFSTGKRSQRSEVSTTCLFEEAFNHEDQQMARDTRRTRHNAEPVHFSVDKQTPKNSKQPEYVQNTWKKMELHPVMANKEPIWLSLKAKPPSLTEACKRRTKTKENVASPRKNEVPEQTEQHLSCGC